MIRYSQFANALNCMATADAVGDVFEFEKRPDPYKVIRRYLQGVDLEITDDTQMALFGLEAICEMAENKAWSPEPVKDAYLRWESTQFTSSSVKDAKGLLAMPSMWKTKAPGNTCLRALAQIRKRGYASNNSSGCGAVMRLLPFVLAVNVWGEHAAIELATACARLTHQHAEVAPAVVLYMEAAFRMAKAERFDYQFLDAKDITELGDGWTSMSCVKMAIWAVHHSRNFDTLLRKSICHPGDSDSVAAVAGSLWGLSKYFTKVNTLSEQDAIDYTLKRTKKALYAEKDH